MITDAVCPQCGSPDLDDGTYTFNDRCGVRFYTPPGNHCECMDCSYSGKAISAGEYQDRLEFMGGEDR